MIHFFIFFAVLDLKNNCINIKKLNSGCIYAKKLYLDRNIQQEAAKWVHEYNPQEDSELAKTANEILGTVDDPKFSNTEVGYYIVIHNQICIVSMNAILGGKI